ncbi:MAG: NAD-dependent dihydropyrimidine dehydrogenase subunit PreA [Candidatus Thorarchaeota archaeon]|nr:MAG: NAD-dependent dihydropyrimidine dehydrogenase subunit PreA [Candidatus Thorarchaeota archaeon]
MAGNDISVEFTGLTFKNPFVLSSAPPTMDARHIIRAAKLGWGGAVMKTVTEEPTVDPRTRLGVLRKNGKAIGMNNIELLSRKPLTTWTEEWIPQIKKEAPEDFVFIASIMSDTKPEGWTALAETMTQTGADAIEINVSCPHGSPEKHMGAFIGQDPSLVEMVTRATKKGTDLPVWVKLTPNVTDIVPIADAAIKGGADAISAINTVESLIGIDIETATPMPIAYGMDNKEQLSTYGGFCGPAVKPLGLRFVSQIAKAHPDFPISGIGGIEDWSSAIEYLMVGASTLQVCTAAMWYGFSIIKDMTGGLSDFMQRKGYESLVSMVGKALPKITSWTALTKLPPVIAQINPEKCTGCKECVIACADGGFVAIQMRENIAIVKDDECDGCGLCAVVCDFDAVEFIHTQRN